jgi:hypothetical protein
MSLVSAYNKIGEVDDPRGYCLPLAIDSLLKQNILPDTYYEMFYTGHKTKELKFNTAISRLITEFFGEDVAESTSETPVAKFTEHGATPQPYFDDVPYDYAEELKNYEGTGVTNKHLRLANILGKAREHGNLVLFSSSPNHVKGLDLIDPGRHLSGALYAIRNYGQVVSNSLYSIADLSGLKKAYGGDYDEHAPIPDVSKSYFPNNEAGWDLLVLPAEPQ